MPKKSGSDLVSSLHFSKERSLESPRIAEWTSFEPDLESIQYSIEMTNFQFEDMASHFDYKMKAIYVLLFAVLFIQFMILITSDVFQKILKSLWAEDLRAHLGPQYRWFLYPLGGLITAYCFGLIERDMTLAYYIYVHVLAYFCLFHTRYMFWFLFFYYIYHVYQWSRIFQPRPPPGHSRCWSVKNERPSMGDRDNSQKAKSLQHRVEAGKTSSKEGIKRKCRGLQQMDHHRISFLYYMFVVTFVIPNATVLWLINNIMFKLRSYCKASKEFNYHEQIIDLILNTSVCRYVHEQVDDDIFVFLFNDLPIMKTWEDVHKNATLNIRIDFKKRRVLSSELQMDEKRLDLELEDCLTCVYFHGITTSHVQSHAMANFCVDTKVSSEMSFLSSITIAYNYFGRTVSESLFATLAMFGMLSQRPVAFTKSLQIGCNCRINEHGNKLLSRLTKYSPYVWFILKLRKFFLIAHDESVKHGRVLSKHVDGEALFVGTVIHSLDHYGLEVVDPCAFKNANPLFEPMMQMCRVVRLGFVEDIPGLVFSTRFRDLQSSFYADIYDFAKTLDETMAKSFQSYTGRREFADHIEAAIIK